MTEDRTFEDLLTRLRHGDEAAATEVFQRYAGRLIALARSRLGGLVRQKLDPEDLVQSVLKSFFCRYGDGQYQLDSWDSLWALLAAITLRKCGHHLEQFQTAKRDLRREVPLQRSHTPSGSAWEILDREPSPAEAAMLAELVEQLLRSLGPRERPIVVLLLQGETPAAIKATLGCSERKVYRVQEHLRAYLERLRDQDEG